LQTRPTGACGKDVTQRFASAAPDSEMVMVTSAGGPANLEGALVHGRSPPRPATATTSAPAACGARWIAGDRSPARNARRATRWRC
jgi:hypothetical protein